MKRYNVMATTLALGIDGKWIDNAITQFNVAGVQRFRRGRDRSLTAGSVLQLAIAHRLWVALGVPVGRALAVAPILIHDGELVLDDVRLSIDVQTIRVRLEHRLADAAEHVVAPRRGRPPLRQ